MEFFKIKVADFGTKSIIIDLKTYPQNPSDSDMERINAAFREKYGNGNIDIWTLSEDGKIYPPANKPRSIANPSFDRLKLIWEEINIA